MEKGKTLMRQDRIFEYLAEEAKKYGSFWVLFSYFRGGKS